jgi:hypothetical protein
MWAADVMLSASDGDSKTIDMSWRHLSVDSDT